MPARLDLLHLVLLLAAAAIARWVPFQLLLLAYAVLGPIHYLTEIAWLHERGYFLPDRRLAVLLGALSLVALLVPWSWPLLAALVLSAAWVWGARLPQRLAGAGIGLAAGLVLLAVPAVHFGVLVLLPTVIHVCLFTLLFMTLGAVRSRSAMQWVLVGTYVLVLATLPAISPPTAAGAGQAVAERYFGSIGEALGLAVGLPALPLPGALVTVLAFAYSYHYLNWFFKVKTINWHRIPPRRWILVAAGSAGATALYLYDYDLGFRALLLLSLLHVVLEFPLDAGALKQLVLAWRQVRTPSGVKRAGTLASR